MPPPLRTLARSRVASDGALAKGEIVVGKNAAPFSLVTLGKVLRNVAAGNRRDAVSAEVNSAAVAPIAVAIRAAARGVGPCPPGSGRVACDRTVSHHQGAPIRINATTRSSITTIHPILSRRSFCNATIPRGRFR